MTTFALVHGAWHGAWCWEKLIPELESRGHQAITMDVPVDDPQATFDTYADTVAAAIEGHGGDVVLVGHSLAGFTIPLVPQRVPVRSLVYLCALIPIPGVSFAEQSLREPDILLPEYETGLTDPDEAGLRHFVDLDVARSVFYADCDDEEAAAAVARLRPQAFGLTVLPHPLEAFPELPAAYVVGTEDRIVNPQWSRGMAPERLGVEPVEMPTGHSPFLSRPGELAALLTSLA